MRLEGALLWWALAAFVVGYTILRRFVPQLPPLFSVNLGSSMQAPAVKVWDGTGLQKRISNGRRDWIESRRHLVEFNVDNFRFELLPEDARTAEAKRRGMQDIVVGDEVFDTTFVVKSNDEQRVRRFLDGRVRTVLMSVANLAKGAPFQVTLDRFRLAVRAKIADRSADEKRLLRNLAKTLGSSLLQFLRSADQAPLPDERDEGISVVTDEDEADEPGLLGLLVCQICGEAVVEDRVDCVLCDTPHHADCWAYNEGCSVFGCESTACRPVGIADFSASGPV